MPPPPAASVCLLWVFSGSLLTEQLDCGSPYKFSPGPRLLLFGMCLRGSEATVPPRRWRGGGPQLQLPSGGQAVRSRMPALLGGPGPLALLFPAGTAVLLSQGAGQILCFALVWAPFPQVWSVGSAAVSREGRTWATPQRGRGAGRPRLVPLL